MLAYKQINGEYQLSRISIKEIMNAILNCKIENVYWFFPIIISVYLFMPFLSMLTAPKYRKVLWYIVICSIVLNATMPLLCTLVGIEWNTNISIPVNGYTIFAILGYLLSTEEINKKNRIIIYAGGIASLEDIEHFRKKTGGKVDFTIGSALDLFGGHLPYEQIKKY